MTPRDDARADFLRAAGWAGASRAHLAGDASARSYERLHRGGQSAVLMDAPGATVEIEDFLKIAAHLASLGLSPPQVRAADPATGFVLLEDLGDDLYTHVIARDPGLEAPLCEAAAGVLRHIQAAAIPPDVPDLTAADWAESALLAVDCYAEAGSDAAGALREALTAALTAHADGPRILILRDFHAGNLLWLPARKGLARVGLLDFQQAQKGQPAYDLVSLLQDARRDVLPAAEAAALGAFGLSRADSAYATLGALRALRILGIFARLCLRDGKPGYLVHLPRVWRQLQDNLAHPALAELRAVCAAILPPADAALIKGFQARCTATR